MPGAGSVELQVQHLSTRTIFQQGGKRTKTGKSVLWITVALGVVCVWAMLAPAYDRPKQLKFKGLCLGTELKTARKICDKFIDNSMFIKEVAPNSFGIFLQTGRIICVFACESDHKLSMIAMGRPILDKMFNSDRIPIEEFAKQFVSAYEIPSMGPFTEQNASGWRFISPYDYEVEIHDTGGLLIQKVAKRGSLKCA